MQDTTTDTDEESTAPITRRDAIATLASAGLLSTLAAGGASLQPNAGIGGGPMAQQIEDLQVEYHVGTKSERPSAGVEGRVYEVYDPGGPDHGAVYYDDGGSWQLADRKLKSVSAEKVNNNDYHEKVVAGDISGTTGLDLSAANFFRHTLTGDVTFEFNNPNSAPDGNSFTLIVQQDGTGGRSITWPSSVEWHEGSPPGLTTGANDKHMVTFVSPDAGATWIGVNSANKIA